MNDRARHSVPQHDEVRHTLTVREVEALFAQAGVLRSHRHVLRLCQSGMLDAVKVPGGPTGDEWYVTPASVPKAIGDLKQIEAQRARRAATQHAMSAPVVPEIPSDVDDDTARHSPPQPAASPNEDQGDNRLTNPDTLRHSTTEGESPLYVAQLEKRIEEKDTVINLLRGELAQRNDEIIRRNERERETNILIRGLQNLVLQLQPGRPRGADILEHDPLMRSGEPVHPVDEPSNTSPR